MTRKQYLFFMVAILIVTISPLRVHAQWKEAFNYKGSWSNWSTSYGNIKHYANESGIILETSGGIAYFKFQINNYIPPTKDEIKQHLKTNQWFVYYGTVDYAVNDEFPDAAALAKANKFIEPDPRNDLTPTVNRHTVAEIRIAPYKELPRCYNVFFDDIGVGIDIQDLAFEGQKKFKNKGRMTANIFMSILLGPIGWTSWIWNPVSKNPRK